MVQFIDEAKIFIASGAGGNGCVSFRREKYVPKGGPDGGNGGKGGDIILKTTKHENTLLNFRYQQHFKAKKGENGKSKEKFGADSQNLYIELPIGTQVFTADGKHLIVDMIQEKQKYKILSGGNGGFGNTHFKSSVNQTPRKANLGQLGQEMWISLKLKILSEVGLVGLPNAGKSTYLAKVTRAKPKIADYPFTTLTPQLGVVSIYQKEFVVADIPGLIQGASQGKGLGDRFLKHIERCKILLHLIDATQDVIKHYKIIRKELENYNVDLIQKPSVVILNKIDVISEDDITKKIDMLKKIVSRGTKILSASIIKGEKLHEINSLLLSEISKLTQIEKNNTVNIVNTDNNNSYINETGTNEKITSEIEKENTKNNQQKNNTINQKLFNQNIIDNIDDFDEKLSVISD